MELSQSYTHGRGINESTRVDSNLFFKKKMGQPWLTQIFFLENESTRVDPSNLWHKLCLESTFELDLNYDNNYFYLYIDLGQPLFYPLDLWHRSCPRSTPKSILKLW
jgi:hypothetical protein